MRRKMCIYKCMLNVYKNQQNRQTGSRCGGYTVLPLSIQDIFRRIFLSNCWWQKSDIWSQASYRYPISWEAFFDPSDSYFLFFNVYKNQLSRQTGSRNLTDPKTLPTIWHTYMKLVTKYQISVINSCLDKCNGFWTHHIPTSCLPTLLIFIHIEHTFCICPFLVAFFSATIHGRNLIFGHKLHIGTKWNEMNCELMLIYDTPALRQACSRNLTGQKTLPAKWGTYMKLVTKYQISAINSCWKKCDEKWAYMFNVYKNQQSRRSYGSWIYNYLCNQCLSPLKLWVKTPFMAKYTG
jgi:hypothetical protein